LIAAEGAVAEGFQDGAGFQDGVTEGLLLISGRWLEVNLWKKNCFECWDIAF